MVNEREVAVNLITGFYTGDLYDVGVLLEKALDNNDNDEYAKGEDENVARVEELENGLREQIELMESWRDSGEFEGAHLAAIEQSISRMEVVLQ